MKSLNQTLKRAVSFVLATAFLASCAHVPFNPQKPIGFQQGFWQSGYAQDGEFVDQVDAEKALETVPAAAEKLSSARKWGWGALGMIAGGAVLSLTTPNSYDHPAVEQGQYWIGLGIILGSIPLSITSLNRQREATQEYNNAKFTTTPKTTMFISPLKDGGQAGVQFTF